jgi:photosystem II stability/assembly factor-like uncharacterized protein
MRTPATAVRGVFVSFIVLGVIFISIINASVSTAGSEALISLDETPTTSPTTPPPLLKLHLPLVLRVGRLELNGAWINNAEGDKQYGFMPGDSLQYVVELNNDSGFDTKVKLTWDQDGPCEPKQVINQEFILKPGVSQVIANEVAPDCFGVYANSIELAYGLGVESVAFNSVVINTSSVILADGQGFDNCTLPTTSQMQTWWDHSPYSTINIYLGGISAACPMNRDSGWLYNVSQQGWSFILTWVGPQAPCTSFNHPMSRNPATAKQQGRDNADAAVASARQKGFLGDLVIYYDLESYSNGKDDPGCRAAVANFMQGWVERIHELGETAGAYGAACTSFMSEWATISDPPDDVWFAHWYTNDYDKDASVWDVPCIDNGLWASNQRLKQYTGGHKETWGGLQKSIDSNVLDGQVSAILEVPLPASAQPGKARESAPEIIRMSKPAFTEFQLLTKRAGWVLRGGRLLSTMDGGSSWQDISPSTGSHAEILGVKFIDSLQGWLVSKSVMDGKITLLGTGDGGESWQVISKLISQPEEVYQIASASLEFIDSQTGFIAFKLHSSSNFSLGRLLATTDGGFSWQERSLPLGEPVNFQNAQHGWISGGPQDQTYFTEDGGQTWILSGNLPESLTSDTDSASLAYKVSEDFSNAWRGLVELEMVNDQNGWAIVQDGSCTGYKLRAGEHPAQESGRLLCESSSQLLMTSDGGESWQDISPP